MNYLEGLTLYLSDYCPQNCVVCSGAFKQFPCCTAVRNRYFSRELEISKLKLVLAEVRKSPLSKLIITGGNILDYSHLDELIKAVNRLPVEKHFYIHYLNILTHPDCLTIFGGVNGQIKIPVTFPVHLGEFESALESVSGNGLKAEIQYIVRTAEDFEAAEALTSLFDIRAPIFLPYCDGTNSGEFEDYVFFGRDGFSGSIPATQEIFNRELIKTRCCGNLVIAATGKIYTDINAPSLGVIGKNTLAQVIERELAGGQSWWKTNGHVQPYMNSVRPE